MKLAERPPPPDRSSARIMPASAGYAVDLAAITGTGKWWIASASGL